MPAGIRLGRGDLLIIRSAAEMLHLQHGVGVGASLARDADRRLARRCDKVAIVDVEIRNRPHSRRSDINRAIANSRNLRSRNQLETVTAEHRRTVGRVAQIGDPLPSCLLRHHRQ
jgi:hypothetical protein